MYIFSAIFGLVQMLLLGCILFREANKKSPAVFLWATLMVMFGVPHFVTSLFGDITYSDGVICEASLFVIAFSLFYLFTRSNKRVSLAQTDKKNQLFSINTSVAGTSFETLCYTVFLVSIIYYMLSSVNSAGGILNTRWSGSSIALGIESEYVSFKALAQRLIFAFSGFSLYFYLTKRKFKAAIVLLLFAMLILITRNRVQMIPLFVFFISLYLIKIEKIKLKHFVLGIIAACVVLYIVYAVRALRWLGTLSSIITNFSWSYINEMVFSFLSEENGELGLRRVFYFFIDSDNNFEGFNSGCTLLRMLLVYIPSRWSFGLKPQSFDLYMGQAIGMITGGTTHPTLFGDCFGNFYWFGIFLGIFWALFVNAIDFLINKQKDDFFKIMIFCLASYSFVIIGRGSVSNGFDPTAWGLLMLAIINVLFSGLKKTDFCVTTGCINFTSSSLINTRISFTKSQCKSNNSFHTK